MWTRCRLYVMSGCPSFTRSCLFPILPSFLTGYNFLLFRLHSSKIYPGSILDSWCQVRICLQSLFNKPKRQDIIMNDTPLPYRWSCHLVHTVEYLAHQPVPSISLFPGRACLMMFFSDVIEKITIIIIKILLRLPSIEKKNSLTFESGDSLRRFIQPRASVLVPQDSQWTGCLSDQIPGPASPPTDHQKLEMVLSFLRSMSCQDVIFTPDQKEFGNGTGLKTLSALEELVSREKSKLTLEKAELTLLKKSWRVKRTNIRGISPNWMVWVLHTVLYTLNIRFWQGPFLFWHLSHWSVSFRFFFSSCRFFRFSSSFAISNLLSISRVPKFFKSVVETSNCSFPPVFSSRSLSSSGSDWFQVDHSIADRLLRLLFLFSGLFLSFKLPCLVPFSSLFVRLISIPIFRSIFQGFPLR